MHQPPSVRHVSEEGYKNGSIVRHLHNRTSTISKPSMQAINEGERLSWLAEVCVESAAWGLKGFVEGGWMGLVL